MWGCDLDKVEGGWSGARVALEQSAQKYLRDGSMELKDSKLVLTNKGKLFADGIAADLFFSEKE
jgi:oxygen-independent coproporphyrinogen-3 oxidase